MALLSGFELLFVLLVVGILFLIAIRMRTRGTVFILLILALLLVALVTLSKLVMALFGATLFLVIVVVFLVLIFFRRS